MQTLFSKIRFDGEKVVIVYTVDRESGGDPDEYSLKSADTPSVEFTMALQALKRDVVDICEFPSTDEKKFTVRGVSLSHTDGVLGVVITALKLVETANAPLVINTPHLAQTDTAPSLPIATADRIKTLCEQAQKYVDGERAQGELFPGIPALAEQLRKDVDAANGATKH